MSDTKLYKRTVAPQLKVPEVKQATGPAQFMNQLADTAGQLASTLQDKSNEIYALNFDTQLRRNMAEIYDNNKNNPGEFEKQAGKYYKSIEGAMPMGIQNKLAQHYQGVYQGYYDQSKKNYEAKLDEDMTQAVLENYDQMVIDIANGAGDLLVPEGTDMTGAQSLASASAFDNASRTFGDMRNLMNMTGVDGRPLFSGQAQAQMAKNARNQMITSAADKWMKSQPDKMAAYKRWSEGGLTMSVRNEKGEVNSLQVKEAFNPDVVKEIDREMLHQAKEQLTEWRQSQVDAKRNDKARQAEVASDLYVKSHSNQLTIQEVEERRGEMNPKEFRELHLLAVKSQRGDPVASDQKLKLDLEQGIFKGEDKSAQIYHALESNYISAPDASELFSKQREFRKSGATDSPMLKGEQFLVEKMGANGMMSSDIARAKAAEAKKIYYSRFNAETAKNGGVPPDMMRAIQIADEIGNDNRVFDPLVVSATPVGAPKELLTSPGKYDEKQIAAFREKTIRECAKRIFATVDGDAVRLYLKDKDFQEAMLADTEFRTYEETYVRILKESQRISSRPKSKGSK